MPRGGDLSQYDSRRDYGTTGDARRAFYDLCRDSGFSHDQARTLAARGAEQLAKDLGGASSPASSPHTISGRSRFRTPWPWEVAAEGPGTPGTTQE